MRTRQNNPSLRHWTHLLMLLIPLLTGVLTDERVIRALLGGTVSLPFKITGNVEIIQTEWNRCPNPKVFVFSPKFGLHILDESFKGRLTAESSHSLLLDKLQESDFGTYCYKLTAFPNGSLEGHIKLVKETTTNDPSAPPVIMIICLTCGTGLAGVCGIIAGVICYKQTEQFFLTVPIGTKDRQRPDSTATQREEEEEHDDGNYMNV